MNNQLLALQAQLMERDAEVQYLRDRNLSLATGIQSLSAQLAPFLEAQRLAEEKAAAEEAMAEEQDNANAPIEILGTEAAETVPAQPVEAPAKARRARAVAPAA